MTDGGCMNVLVLGATGLIGGHVLRALRTAGCDAVGASRQRPAAEGAAGWIEIDFGRMTEQSGWLPLLAGVDAVVNCVGIIREARDGDFDRLHRAAPVALFAACERLGVRRVVQVSALGSHPDAATGYWRSKGAAEVDQMARRLSAIIVRPSLVYGDDGASSEMFRMLATLPALVLAQGEVPRELAVVGPRATTMAGYLGALRGGMRAAPSLVLDLPMPVARIVARVAGMVPSSALTPESLRMLEQSADGGNTADAGPAAAMLGRPLRDPDSFARPDQRIVAAWTWGAPLLTVAMAVLWLVTAYVSWFGWPRAESLAWLAACGVPAELRQPMLMAASLADAAVGMLLLLTPRRWLWALQLALVCAYTVGMSVYLPGFWLHPFGPLTKNLPLLALMFLMWRAGR